MKDMEFESRRTQKMGVHSDKKSLAISEKYSGKRLHC
jgi:hypothetical protein